LQQSFPGASRAKPRVVRRVAWSALLVLSAGCTSSEPADGEVPSLSAPAVEAGPVPGTDGWEVGASDTALEDAAATDDGFPAPTPVSPPSVDPDDDDSAPGSCGAPAGAAPTPIATPTCGARERGWRKIAQPGDLAKDMGFGGGETTVYTGREVLLLGHHPDSKAIALGYDPALDKWRKLPAPPTMHLRTVFAQGRWYTAQGFSEEGVEHPMSVDVYDAATDAWTTLPPAPIVERLDAAMVWSTTTNELVIWGGARAGWKGYAVDELDLADGAAWNPATRTWRTLAAAPLKGRFVVASAWDGAHLVVAHAGRDIPGEGVGGNYPVSRAALYDPQTDAWTKLCDPPASKRIARSAATIGAAGELAVLWGGWPGYGGDGDGEPDFQDGSIFDRKTFTWRLLPKPPIEGAWDMAVRWTAGGKLWAWGLPVAPGVTGGVVYDPAVNAWSTISDLWGPPAYQTATAWTGCDLVAYTASGWASLRPE
jgi:hypothetical protein